MRLRAICLAFTVLASSNMTFGQDPGLDDPRPIDMRDTVWLEELTWMEVRDLIAAGTTTIIVSTGGVEQNGPYLATGKHNYVLQAACPAIARKLGNALCAPIVPFVPEGDIEPPSGMMRYPGTISVTAATYEALLTDIASSLKQHGFEHIVLIGDSGGNQEGLKAVASKLSKKWAGSKTSIHYIPEFYDYPGLWKWSGETFGWKEEREGLHDDPTISSIMMTVDPAHVRIEERQAKGKASINGISLVPVSKAVEHGNKIVEHRAEITVAAIRKATATKSTQTNTNPRFGKWKLKSDRPAPYLNIMTYEPYGENGMRITVEATNEEGEYRKWGYVTLFDGKYRPVTGDSSTEESAVVTLDERTNKIMNKRGDRVNEIINVLSEDGNTINNEYRNVDENGKVNVFHAVYERIK